MSSLASTTDEDRRALWPVAVGRMVANERTREAASRRPLTFARTFAGYLPADRFAKCLRTAAACFASSIQAVFLCSAARWKFERRYARMSLPEMFSSFARSSGRTYLTVAMIPSFRSFVRCALSIANERICVVKTLLIRSFVRHNGCAGQSLTRATIDDPPLLPRAGGFNPRGVRAESEARLNLNHLLISVPPGG